MTLFRLVLTGAGAGAALALAMVAIPAKADETNPETSKTCNLVQDAPEKAANPV